MTQQSIYLWQGISEQGQKISGEIAAPTLNLAKYYLIKKKINFARVKRKPTFNFKSIPKINSTDLILFFRQLATLNLAGVSLYQAISLLGQHPENTKFLFILTSLKNDINAGKQFTDCLRKFPRYFDHITCSLIEAGEKTGTIDIMLERVATYKESAANLKNKIVEALFYPAITVAVALIVSFIMLTFIVPRFADLFLSMHSQLPAFTLFIIHLGNFLRRFSGLLTFLFVAMLFATYYAQRWPRVKFYFDRCLIKIPLLGNQLAKFILARFARSLAIIFAAGIPITEALNILTYSTGNLLYTQALQKLHWEISSGKPLHHAMHQNPLFPGMMRQMIQVGEESGTLDQMLHKIADFYEAEIDHFVAKLSKALEPLIMIILGVLIGGLVIAMYLPIFKLGTVI